MGNPAVSLSNVERGKVSPIGFFDTYEAPPTGTFVTSDEKRALIESGETFEITKIVRRAGQFGPEQVVEVNFENGETRPWSFSADPEKAPYTRIDQLDAMADYLKNHAGETVLVRLTEVGRSMLLVEA